MQLGAAATARASRRRGAVRDGVGAGGFRRGATARAAAEAQAAGAAGAAARGAGAFLVWIESGAATGGFRTVLVEPAGENPRVIAERQEVVVASSKELWVLRTKKTKVTNCGVCDVCMRDSTKCKKTETASVDEPQLESLATGRVQEPSIKNYTFESGCSAMVASQDAGVTFAGAVGTFFFADVSKSTTRCGGDEQDDGSSFAFDMDKEAIVELTLPDPPTETLSAKAKADLIVQGCASDHAENPTLYRSRAVYGDDGVLRGLYGFTMSAGQGCANGPDHQTALSEQKSPWIPPSSRRTASSRRT